MIEKVEKAVQSSAVRQERDKRADEAPVKTRRGAARDSVALQTDWQDTDWEAAVRDALESLQQSFPGIKIVTGTVQDKEELRKLAQSLGTGKHLVIDQRFLEQMSEGPEGFQKGYETLLRLLRTVNFSDITGVYVGEDKAVGWTYYESPPVNEELEQAKQLLRQFAQMNQPRKEEPSPLLQAPPRNYSTKGKYNRLARAATVGQINVLVSDIYGTINSLQGEAMSGDGERAMKARRAIRSLRALAIRASRKITRLQAEQLLSAKKKRAEREQRQQEAAELRRAQRNARSKRMRADQNTAASGITQAPPQSKKYKRGYEAFAAQCAPPIAVPACPPPVAETGAADAGGTVVLGPEISL